LQTLTSTALFGLQYILVIDRKIWMSESIVILMLGVSTFLGALGLIALLWGVKSGQFDDQSKFIDGARYDNEEDLQDAKMIEDKRRERERKRRANYRPE
jgi:cbb3-type cytochrome oxidase maturation protein